MWQVTEPRAVRGKLLAVGSWLGTTVATDRQTASQTDRQNLPLDNYNFDRRQPAHAARSVARLSPGRATRGGPKNALQTAAPSRSRTKSATLRGTKGSRKEERCAFVKQCLLS